jgi:perosamine synthetase
MAMLIPHNKPTIGQEEIEAVVDALSNLELTIGSKVKTFEHLFSEYIGISSVSTSSGTSALHLALNSIGISKEDQVIVPSYTCIAVALPILYQQAHPILVDVKDDYNISAEEIIKNITERTKAIVVPHMFGYPADLDEIKELCVDNDIYLVEDCSQSIDALYKGKKVGTIGDIAIFSFYATKMITSIKGGMVCTRNKEWIQKIKDLRYHDQCRALEDTDRRIKYSYMMSDIEASVGTAQLKKLEYFVDKRRVIAKMYDEGFSSEGIKLPIKSPIKKHVYSRYVIRASYNPSKVIEEMRRRGIICERMHLPPLHKRELFNKYNYSKEFINTDRIINSAISLPIYPTLENEDVNLIIDSLNEILRDYE